MAPNPRVRTEDCGTSEWFVTGYGGMFSSLATNSLSTKTSGDGQIGDFLGAKLSSYSQSMTRLVSKSNSSIGSSKGLSIGALVPGRGVGRSDKRFLEATFVSNFMVLS